MKINWPKFTFHSIGQSLPIWKKVFTNGWNIILFIALIILNIVAYQSSVTGGQTTSCVSVILFFHRYFIAYNGKIISELMKEK